MDEIKEAARKARWAEDDLARAVCIAKYTGTTWRLIGDTLGISRQAAQQRFARTYLHFATRADRPSDERCAQIDADGVRCWRISNHDGMPGGGDHAFSTDPWFNPDYLPGRE